MPHTADDYLWANQAGFQKLTGMAISGHDGVSHDVIADWAQVLMRNFMGSRVPAAMLKLHVLPWHRSLHHLGLQHTYTLSVCTVSSFMVGSVRLILWPLK